jgi:hypothetical protein
MLQHFARSRRLLAGVAVVSALVAAGVVTASVASPGRVLALPGATESTVVPVEPTRVLDTRYNIGVTGKLVSGTPKTFQVTGTINTWTEANKKSTRRVVVPAGATGVLLNVTAVSPTGVGHLSIRPGNATGVPATAGLNFAPGDVVANAVTVAVPTAGANAGQIGLHYWSPVAGATMDVVIDIVGYTTNTGLLDIVNRITALETASPARVVWVADDGTGDYPLLSTALTAITDATSSKPYVIKIAPGIYTETALVVLKDYVDVEGSGQDITTINCACSANILDASAAVISATAITAEIRHLTVNNTGGSNISFGVYTNVVANGSFSMLHVTATATGGTDSNYGVFNFVSSSPTMNNVTATATGSTNNYGVNNFVSSSPTMNNVTATATGGTNNYGVNNYDGSSPTMNNVTATATGGTDSNYGVFNFDGSSPTMNNVTATATGSNYSYGVNNYGGSYPSIRNSSITGTTNSIYNDSSNAQVADTALGGAVAGTGFTCIGVYDTAFAPLNASCV